VRCLLTNASNCSTNFAVGTQQLYYCILKFKGQLCANIFDEGCGKAKALEAATLHPARVLGIADRRGTFNPGADADIVVLDDDYEVLSTWIAGRCRYTRKPVRMRLSNSINQILV
jgi:imidazolonepropionase-like amidohydrolase